MQPMTFTRFFKAPFFLSIVLVFGVAPKGPPFSPYIIGPNVQVSISQPMLQHYETQIAADPEQAGHLIAGAYAVRPDQIIDNVFYVSFDHGRTWSHTLTVPVGVDPACAIGSKGTTFTASIHDVTQPDAKR